MAEVRRLWCCLRSGPTFRRYVTLALVLLLLCFASFVGYFFYDVNRPNPVDAPTHVTIERGDTSREIVQKLNQAGFRIRPTFFVFYLRVNGLDRRLRAGTFVIPPNASMKHVLSVLIYGEAARVNITIPEGLRIGEVLGYINGHRKLSGPPVQDAHEGMILPDTYQFDYGTKRTACVAYMAQALKQCLARYQQQYPIPAPLRNAEEVVILASLVERETAHALERPLIASVYLNRLRKGMLLQSDPAVTYGRDLLDPDKAGELLSRSDLKQETAFNSYLVRGLPPTPICCPGEASIHAVFLNHQTPYLFFVGDGHGRHFFSRDYRGHQYYHKRLRNLRRQLKQGQPAVPIEKRNKPSVKK